MKKVAFIITASVNQEVYKYYIENYWSRLIKYTNIYEPNIDIYLLFSRHIDLTKYNDIRNNIIVDGNYDYNNFVKEEDVNDIIPGILSKVIYAYEILKDKYDVLFRTNLSSLVNVTKIKAHVQSNDIIYSGQLCWKNALRESLVHSNRIGPDKSIKSLAELEMYEGDTFISGCGHFINTTEINHILKHKHKIRYDIIDDVSIGLMLTNYEILEHFLTIIREQDTYIEIINKLNINRPVVRLEHLSVNKAKEIYSLVRYNYQSYLP